MASLAGRTDKAQLRITRWPNAELPPPVAEVWSAHRLPGDWITYGENIGPRPLAEELVLRGLRELDVHDRDAVAAFVGEHGMIARTAIESGLGVPVRGHGERPTPNATHHVDVALHLRAAQILADHWIAHLEGTPVGEAWMGSPWPHGGPLDLRDELAWSHFAMLLNAGLKAHPPHIEVHWGETGLDPYGSPHFGLYSALCIQLLNLMAANVPVHRCANETCARVFGRQLGRAQQGQHRSSGVMYCSPECARAQAQREYRRRKRQGGISQ